MPVWSFIGNVPNINGSKYPVIYLYPSTEKLYAPLSRNYRTEILNTGSDLPTLEIILEYHLCDATGGGGGGGIVHISYVVLG